METSKDRATAARFIVALGLPLVSGLLIFLFSHFASDLFPAYRAFSKGLISNQAAIASVIPVAIWDFALLGFVVAILVSLVARVIRKKRLLPWLSVIVVVISSLAFVFVAGWGLNHYAPPLADELGLQTHESSTQQLADATSYYLQRAAAEADAVPRDENGKLASQDFFDLAKTAGSAYAPLGERFGVFEGGSDAPIKALVLWGEPLLYSGYVGIFFSPTGESSVPFNCAPADLPYTMCHEAAHRLAIAGEEEANFAAYLACTASDDARFRYAGNYNAFAYCFNALYGADPERAKSLVKQECDSGTANGVSLVMLDMASTSAHYKAYEGDFQTLGEAVNDSYLKGFGEDSGVRSYGLVVDYLIAWHEKSTA